MKRFVKVTNLRLNPFKEEIDNKMKGKFKLLGHFGVALFVVSALMLAFMPAAPVQAATAVTDVWVEFPGDMSSTYEVTRYAALANDTDLNKTNSEINMIVHFTTETALKANIDTITIFFPDGSTELSGSGNTSGKFQITALDVTVGGQNICVDPDGSGTTYGYHDITTAATLAGYRLKVTTPIDIAAGASPYIYIEQTSSLKTPASDESSNYKIKMQTSKDTTLVLSPTFAVGASASTPDPWFESTSSLVASPSIAGAGSTLTFTFDCVNGIVAETDTITVIFPAGTTVPSSIAASQIECQVYDDAMDNGTGQGYQACSTTPTVHSDARMVTVTSPVSSTANDHGFGIRFKTGVGITLPQVITAAYNSASVQYAYLDYYIYTSNDRLMAKGTGGGAEETGNFKVTAGAAYQLAFNNDAYYGANSANTYSADCAIINGLSGALYLQVQDKYGNLVVTGTGRDATCTYSCSAGSVYTIANTGNSTTSTDLDGEGEETLYFRATSAGTHTITASSGSYVDGTWEVTVAPAVALYDGNLQLVSTFAPISTDETPTEDGGYYVKEAVEAAMAGDTIRLGEGIYELTNVGTIELSKAITIEAVSGTTPVLRRTGTPNYKHITISKGATLDGLTFRGLRWTTEFNGGFVTFDAPSSSAGPIIKNCTFEDFIAQYGGICWIVDASGDSATTSGTISNNTFQNIIGYGWNCVLYIQTDFANISGFTISDNTFLNNAAYLINIYASSTYSITDATISGNTISSNRHNDVGIDICASGTSSTIGSATLPIKIINNEISGCLGTAIRLTGDSETTVTVSFPGVRIKRNYIHDNAGSGIEVLCSSAATAATAETATAVEIMYNDIVDNAHTSGTYGIKNTLKDADADAKVTALYNWFGDASGPTVSANVGGTGDTVGTYVVYSPWLYKSRTDVVADNVAYSTARMNLVSGWNTLSTPVKLIEAADAVDELISADDMEIAYYYATGWHQIIGTYVLSPCDAVYVKMSTTASPLLKFDAGAWTMPSKDLDVGWNLISLAYLDSAGKYEKSAVASVALTAAGLPGYSQVISPSMNAAQTDLFGTSGSSWTYSYGEHATGINTMYAGLGYWVYMQNAATLAGFTITPITPDLD